MTGGDERAATHAAVLAIRSGDEHGALRALETLLLVLARDAAADIVTRARRDGNRRGWDGRTGPLRGQ